MNSSSISVFLSLSAHLSPSSPARPMAARPAPSPPPPRPGHHLCRCRCCCCCRRHQRRRGAPGKGRRRPTAPPSPMACEAAPGTRAPRQPRPAWARGRREGGAGCASSAARPLTAAAHRPAPGLRGGGGDGRGGAARLLRREGGRAGRAAATNPDSGAPPRARPQPLAEEGVGNMIMTAQAVRPPGSFLLSLVHGYFGRPVCARRNE